MSAALSSEVTRGQGEQYVHEDLRRCRESSSSGGLSWEDGDGYVQWAMYADYLQIEISSEAFMDRSYTPQELQALRFMGFHRPRLGEDLPNHWQQFKHSRTRARTACDHDLPL